MSPSFFRPGTIIGSSLKVSRCSNISSLTQKESSNMIVYCSQKRDTKSTYPIIFDNYFCLKTHLVSALGKVKMPSYVKISTLIGLDMNIRGDIIHKAIRGVSFLPSI